MVLDKRKVRESIFSDTSQWKANLEHRTLKKEEEKETSELQKSQSSEVPKFRSFRPSM
jgi:hypothetical protein